MVDIKNILGEDSSSNENALFISDENLVNFDFLIFFDSRGMTNNINDYTGTLLYKLKLFLVKNNFSYLIISRPKNLTTFSTLYNFLKINENLKFNFLITNLGFVDFTPKKDENINDMQLQISQYLDCPRKIINHEHHELLDGKTVILKSIEYSKEFISKLGNYFNSRFERLNFINTPIIKSDILIERERPLSFFSQLDSTNFLVESLSNINSNKSKLINIKNFNFTYDGVHYTKEGHLEIYNKILKDLNI